MVGGIATGVLLAVGGYAPGVVALGVCLLLSGVAGSLISVAGTVSVFHGFPVERRGAALGVRQMSVAAGGLSPRSCCPGSPRSAASGSRFVGCGVLTAVTSVALRARISRRAAARRRGRGTSTSGRCSRRPGMLRLLTIGFLLVCALTTILTFIVPAARASGFSTAAAASLFTVVSLSAMAARIVFGRLADRDGGSRRRTALRDIAPAGDRRGRRLLARERPGARGAAARGRPSSASGPSGSTACSTRSRASSSGPERAGQAVGLAATVLFGGGAIGTVPLGFLADWLGYRALWPAAAVLALGGALLSLGLPRAAPQLP